MNNPFETIEERLVRIEKLIIDLKDELSDVKQEDRSEKLLNVHEAAEFLMLTPPTIYSKVSRGELPVRKRGKRLYFSSTELMDYIKTGIKK